MRTGIEEGVLVKPLQEDVQRIQYLSARVDQLEKRLCCYENEAGEKLLLVVARLQLEAWDAGTQASVLLVNKATYTEFLPRISRAVVCISRASPRPEDPYPPGNPRSFTGANGLQELTIMYNKRGLMSADGASACLEAQAALLTHLTALHSLSLVGMHPQLSGLELPPSLTGLHTVSELRIHRFHLVGGLQHLLSLSQLVRLELIGVQLDLQQLPALPSLHTLQLRSLHTRIKISDLTRHTSLKTLHVMDTVTQSLTRQNAFSLPFHPHVPSPGHMDPLAALTGLQELNVQYLRPLNNLCFISSLTALTSLNASGTGFTSLQPLAALTRLQTLQLARADDFQGDLSPLHGLRRLQHLDLADTEVMDLQPLAQLSALQHVDLSFPRLIDQWPDDPLAYDGPPIISLAPLAALSSLHFLDIRGRPVADLALLSAMQQLVVITPVDDWCRA